MNSNCSDVDKSGSSITTPLLHRQSRQSSDKQRTTDSTGTDPEETVTTCPEALPIPSREDSPLPVSAPALPPEPTPAERGPTLAEKISTSLDNAFQLQFFAPHAQDGQEDEAGIALAPNTGRAWREVAQVLIGDEDEEGGELSVIDEEWDEEHGPDADGFGEGGDEWSDEEGDDDDDDGNDDAFQGHEMDDNADMHSLTHDDTESPRAAPTITSRRHESGLQLLSPTPGIRRRPFSGATPRPPVDDRPPRSKKLKFKYAGTHSTGGQHGEAGGRRMTALEAFFSVTNSVLGAGMLSMPYAFQRGGVFAAICCAFLTIVYFYTAMLIARSLKRSQGFARKHGIACASQDWPYLGFAAFGKRGRSLVSCFLSIELYAILIGFLVITGVNLELLAPELSVTSAIALASVLSFLLLMVPHWFLSYFSLIANSAMLVCLVAFVWTGLSLPPDQKAPPVSFANWASLPEAIGIINYCFVAHSIFPTVHSSMARPQNFRLSAGGAFLVASTLYLVTGLFGYAYFGPALGQQLTANLGRDLMLRPLPHLGYLAPVSTFCIVVKSLGSLPLFAAPLLIQLESAFNLFPEEMIESLHHLDTPLVTSATALMTPLVLRRHTGAQASLEPPVGPLLASPVSSIISTVRARRRERPSPPPKYRGVQRLCLRLLFLASVAVASTLLRSSLAALLGLTGCLFSMCTCVLFPATFFWRISHKSHHDISLTERIALVCLVLFGITCQVLGTFTCIADMVTG